MGMLPYIASPLVCGLIGWFTNYLAVKMLFYPREEIRVLGIPVQGVFPKRKAALAATLGEMIEKHLISGADVAALLNDDGMRDSFHDLVDRYLDRILKEKLVEAVPMAAMFLNEATVARIKGALLPELEKLVPEILRNVSSELEERVDISGHVRARIEGFPNERIEEMMLSVMQSELRFIEVVGGVLGLAIGVIQSAIFAIVA